MYIQEHGMSGLGGLADSLGKPTIDKIGFAEVTVTRLERDGRMQVSFNRTGDMPQAKRDKFIKRFIDPMLKHKLATELLLAVNGGKHPVAIAWDNGKFGFTGTIALDRDKAVNGQGSAALIFIDQDAPDWKSMETIVSNPDVGLFHELLHARHIQKGTVTNDEEEMERQVIGIGKYTKARCTENGYRDARNLQRRCCWKREKLE